MDCAKAWQNPAPMSSAGHHVTGMDASSPRMAIGRKDMRITYKYTAPKPAKFAFFSISLSRSSNIMVPLSFLKQVMDIIPPLPAIKTGKRKAILGIPTSKSRITINIIPRNIPSENVMTIVKDIFCALFMIFLLYPPAILHQNRRRVNQHNNKKYAEIDNWQEANRN
jgi:hypothetical protein